MITLENAGRSLLSARWIFAKTMPQNPHWYTLRKDWSGSVSFDDVVIFMRKYGYTEYYKGRPYTMLNVNDMKYWTMGAPISETILINRKPHLLPGVYDKIAAQYDNLFCDPESDKENREVISMIEGGNSVLDIGCGTGLYLDYANPEKYTGIDPSGGMLNILRKKHPTRETLQTRFEDFVNGRFDLIISLFGSASYINPAAIKRIPLMLNPGGSYFAMFYKPGYHPVTYEKTGVEISHFPDGYKNLPGDIFEYHNYLIARGSV